MEDKTNKKIKTKQQQTETITKISSFLVSRAVQYLKLEASSSSSCSAQTSWLKALASQVWKHPRPHSLPPSLGNLFQCLTILTVKKFFTEELNPGEISRFFNLCLLSSTCVVLWRCTVGSVSFLSISSSILKSLKSAKWREIYCWSKQIWVMTSFLLAALAAPRGSVACGGAWSWLGWVGTGTGQPWPLLTHALLPTLHPGHMVQRHTSLGNISFRKSIKKKWK